MGENERKAAAINRVMTRRTPRNTHLSKSDRWIVRKGFYDLIAPSLERVIIDHKPDEFLSRSEALKELIAKQERYRAELQDEVNSIIGEIAAARAELGQERFAE